MFSNPMVTQALKRGGSYRDAEDTHIPVTAAMLKEFEQIFDRDLPTYEAIAMKAIVWMTTFCMMRLSEFTYTDHHAGAHQSHTIKKENVSLIVTGAQPGISVTFLSWKSST